MAETADRFGETFGIGSCTRLGRGCHAKVDLWSDPDGTLVEAFFVSAIVAGLAEIGDNR